MDSSQRGRKSERVATQKPPQDDFDDRLEFTEKLIILPFGIRATDSKPILASLRSLPAISFSLCLGVSVVIPFFPDLPGLPCKG